MKVHYYLKRFGRVEKIEINCPVVFTNKNEFKINIPENTNNNTEELRAETYNGPHFFDGDDFYGEFTPALMRIIGVTRSDIDFSIGKKKIYGMGSSDLSKILDQFIINPVVNEKHHQTIHIFGDVYRCSAHYLSGDQINKYSSSLKDGIFFKDNDQIIYICMPEYSKLVNSYKSLAMDNGEFEYYKKISRKSSSSNILRLECLGCLLKSEIYNIYLWPCIDVVDNCLKVYVASEFCTKSIIKRYREINDKKNNMIQYLYEKDLLITSYDKSDCEVAFLPTKYRCVGGIGHSIGIQFLIKLIKLHQSSRYNRYSGSLIFNDIKKTRPTMSYRIEEDKILISYGKSDKNKVFQLNKGQTSSILKSEKYKFGRNLEI